MTFKDKVIKYLEDFIDDKFCDYATGRDIRVFVLPHIKSMQEDPVSEDVVSAANHAWLKSKDTESYADTFTDGFKAGAQWQKEQFEKNRLKHCDSITSEQAELEQGFIDQHLDKYQRMPTFLDAIEYGMRLKEKEMQSTIELAEDHAMFAGMEKMKEQMMKDAVDFEVLEHEWNGDTLIPVKGLNIGDKIKLIIIKE